MEEYKKEVSLESILYAALSCKDVFLANLKEYENLDGKDEKVVKEITKILPFKYRFLLKAFFKTFGSRPINEVIDIFSEYAKEFFETEFGNKPTQEVLDEFFSKYLKGF
jgi:hypothetical protein